MTSSEPPTHRKLNSRSLCGWDPPGHLASSRPASFLVESCPQEGSSVRLGGESLLEQDARITSSAPSGRPWTLSVSYEPHVHPSYSVSSSPTLTGVGARGSDVCRKRVEPRVLSYAMNERLAHPPKALTS
ncbi:hypothetical protein PAL_GLEAN10002336 [Pteropus alecto]|uniref:Uncharacterized protein n=1 Tax=Pteropus alecto TaxID=9402 RepID=L5KBT9_PTEAL|nr:hypothetical protein PAL_GLEAN10002336 [Pteropus alecto]